MIRSRFVRWSAGPAALAGLAVMMLTDSAHAQIPARLPKEDSGMLQWVVMLGIAVLLGAVVFMNPKRTHQD